MSERPTLTVSASCPTCGGKGKRYTNGECEDCDGIGTVRKQVSCAGCKWWNHGHYCAKKDIFNCEPEFGCLSWEAKA